MCRFAEGSQSVCRPVMFWGVHIMPLPLFSELSDFRNEGVETDQKKIVDVHGPSPITKAGASQGVGSHLAFESQVKMILRSVYPHHIVLRRRREHRQHEGRATLNHRDQDRLVLDR